MEYKFKKFTDERINEMIQEKGEEIEKTLKLSPLPVLIKNLFLKDAYNYLNQDRILARLRDLRGIMKKYSISDNSMKKEIEKNLKDRGYNSLR